MHRQYHASCVFLAGQFSSCHFLKYLYSPVWNRRFFYRTDSLMNLFSCQIVCIGITLHVISLPKITIYLFAWYYSFSMTLKIWNKKISLQTKSVDKRFRVCMLLCVREKTSRCAFHPINVRFGFSSSFFPFCNSFLERYITRKYDKG